MYEILDEKWKSKLESYIELLPYTKEINYKDVPASLSLLIARYVQQSSTFLSEWKFIATELGIENSSTLRTLEDRAKSNGDLPLYVVLTYEYNNHPDATLNNVLECFFNNGRYALLLKIKNKVEAIVNDYRRQLLSKIKGNTSAAEENNIDNFQTNDDDSDDDLSSLLEQELNFDSNDESKVISETEFDNEVNATKVNSESFSCEDNYFHFDYELKTDNIGKESLESDSDVEIKKHSSKVRNTIINEDNLYGAEFDNNSNSESYDEKNCNMENIENTKLDISYKVSANMISAKDKSNSYIQEIKTYPSIKSEIMSNDWLFSCIRDILSPSCISNESIKIVIVHSSKMCDYDNAELLGKKLRNDNFTAVTDYQLASLWMVGMSDYRKLVLHWADVVIIMITNDFLDDIECIPSKNQRSTNSLDARYMYKLLENNYINSASINYSSIPVYMEGTNHTRFRRHPVLRNAIPLWEEYTQFVEIIPKFYAITKDAKHLYQ